MTREFDPVLSAGLRRELEALADGATRQARTTAEGRSPRRRQAWVTAVTAVVLIAATVGVLRLTADRTPAPASPADPSLSDPMTQLADPTWPGNVRGDVQPLLQRHGSGPTSVVLEVPAGVAGVRAYVRCSPEGRFTLTLDGPSSARCSADDQSDVEDVQLTPGRHVVALDVPAGTSWRLAVVVSPGTTGFSTLEVTQAP